MPNSGDFFTVQYGSGKIRQVFNPTFLDIPEFGHLGAASVFLPPHFARPNQNLLNRRKNRPVDPVKGEHEAITLNAFRLANR